jgi:hypothetical protein
MNKYLEKIDILLKYFSIYGIGNFDLTRKEMAEILQILNSKNIDIKLKELYERLSKTRLG